MSIFHCECFFFVHNSCLKSTATHAIQPFIYIPAAIDDFYIKEKLHTIEQYKIVGTSKTSQFSIIIFTTFIFQCRTDFSLIFFYLQFCTQATPGGLAVLKKKTEKEMVVKNGMK